MDEGIKNPEVSISAFGEVLEQLYKSDKYQTLITLDGFNAFFQPSQYPSFRYDNNKRYKSCIPPYDLALARLLMKFDGHFIRNGVKVAATSHYRFFNHTMEPSAIKFPDGYHQRVSNLKLNDFRNAMKYYEVAGFWQNRYQREFQVESLFMETQGNWHAFKDSWARYQQLHY